MAARVILIDFGPLAANIGLGNFTFIGSAGQSAARQVKVIQAGSGATARIFVGNDSTADLVLNVTIADDHALTAADFDGVNQPNGQTPLVGQTEPEAAGTMALLPGADIGGWDGFDADLPGDVGRDPFLGVSHDLVV